MFQSPFLRKQMQTATDIVELLNRHQPAFQLQSGTPECLSSEAHFVDGPRETGAIERKSYASGDDVLRFIAETVRGDWVTLETGGGRSTCVFAATAKTHYCINPDMTANDLVRAFLTQHGQMKAELHFLARPSDQALPELSKDVLVDLAYVDGNHSFPIPIIDWHYMDVHLRQGGLLLVDDTQIRSVGILTEYLAAEESYAFERMLGNTSVWKKTKRARTWGWSTQGFNRVEAATVPTLRADVGFVRRVARRARSWLR